MLQVSKMDYLEDGAVAKAELKVACAVLLMVLVFLLSWLPYAALAMVVYNPDIHIDPSLVTVPVTWLSTVYNSIIYIYCNGQFQRYAMPCCVVKNCGKMKCLREQLLL